MPPIHIQLHQRVDVGFSDALWPVPSQPASTTYRSSRSPMRIRNLVGGLIASPIVYRSSCRARSRRLHAVARDQQNGFHLVEGGTRLPHPCSVSVILDLHRSADLEVGLRFRL